MTVRRNPAGWPGLSISESVTVPTGDGTWIVLSGLVDLTDDGSIRLGTVGEQAAGAFRCIEAALRRVGGTLDDVVRTTVYLTDLDEFPAFAAVRDELFPAGRLPASTAVEVAKLSGGAAIEIEATAFVPR